MKKLLIFGGTTEGRELAEWCGKSGISADVSVTTDYGAGLLGNDRLINVFTGKLDCGEMETLIRAGGYAAVIDATHPYAAEATANIRDACRCTESRYYRLIREECELSGKCVESPDELITVLNSDDRTVLSTLGSKEFPVFTHISDFRKRVWFRVLPTVDIADICDRYGFDPSHIIAETPPYPVAANIGHIRKSGAEILVTKECGIKGGYPEKIAAAKECGIETITIKRPADSGYSFDELTKILGKIL